MGIRYSNLSDNLEQDQLRPRMIYPQTDEHVKCPELNPKSIYEIYYEEKKLEIIKKCCKNFCVFCIFNLTDFDNLERSVENFLSIFKIKNLYIIFIVKSIECPLVGQLKKDLYDFNGVILTAEQYRILLGFFDEDKCILHIAECIENEWKPESFKEIADSPVIDWPRNRMASIIEFQINKRNIKKG